MSDALEWGYVPSDSDDQEAMKRKIADGTWIKASKARNIVSQGWHGEGKPTDAIIYRARHKDVLVKVRHWVWTETDNEGEAKFEKHEQIVPNGFWDDCDIEQNWSQGDFRSVIYPDDGKKYEHDLIDVTFERSGIEAMVAKSVSVSVGQSTGKAERECEAWLLQQFAADPEKRTAKASFQADAIAQFGTRLSGAGFRRVWAQLAPSEGRNEPGCKSKS